MSRAPANAYVEGVRAGDRRMVAKTITLLESTRSDHAALGQQVLERLVPHTGSAFRVGITGTPGVGKSTFIEALGLRLVREGRSLGVLAVDPSSPRTGGSILGDKTRMEALAREEAAFIRPSPSAGSLGGVAHRTREAMLVCEAAGYDVILVETVGVGQSEAAVASLVDFFLVLLQPGAGDELQGIKKGVLELADALVVNKCDGEQAALAARTRLEHAHALELMRPSSPSWSPPVLTASARTGEGIEAIWAAIEDHHAALSASGELEEKRRQQSRTWMWTLVEEGLHELLRSHPAVTGRIAVLEKDVAAQRITPAAAARALLDVFRSA